MEAFSILKFWRISTALGKKDEEDKEEDSFFDLEFALPFYPAAIGKENIDCPKQSTPTTMLFKNSKRSGTGGEDKRKSINTCKFKSKSKSKVKCEELGEEKIRISSILQGIRSEIPKRNPNNIKCRKQKRFILGGKDMVSRYLKLIKPLLLYVRVSRRRRTRTGGERVKLFSQVNTAAATVALRSPAPRRKSADEKHDEMGLSSKQNYLRKSRSASSAVGLVRDPARRDDTLMEQHEGIQAAILHCKRSFTK